MIHNPESDATITATITTMVHAGISDPPPVMCGTCDGEGRIPCAGGYGDQAGGWAETCPDCDGRPVEVSFADLPTFVPFHNIPLGMSQLTSDPPPDDAPGDDCPDHGPYDDDCPKCLNCSKAHHTWRCPEIYTLLFAEPVVMVMDTDFAPVGWPV